MKLKKITETYSNNEIEEIKNLSDESGFIELKKLKNRIFHLDYSGILSIIEKNPLIKNNIKYKTNKKGYTSYLSGGIHKDSVFDFIETSRNAIKNNTKIFEDFALNYIKKNNDTLRETTKKRWLNILKRN